MTIDNDQDLRALLRIGRIVRITIDEMADAMKPGMTTRQLDAIGARVLERFGARSAPILMYKFPGATCISINHEVAHGIPGDRVIEPGDVVNIDVSAELDGYFADAGASYAIPPTTEAITHLLASTQEALDAAIASVSAGAKLNAIGRAVETVAAKSGYRIIRELGGHGVGRALHEEPRNVPNYFTQRAKDRLGLGTVLTIEPFLTPGRGDILKDADGWTLKTRDGAVAAQYEHTLVVTEGEAVRVTVA
jgi:methionyl aminopeptidase